MSQPTTLSVFVPSFIAGAASIAAVGMFFYGPPRGSDAQAGEADSGLSVQAENPQFQEQLDGLSKQLKDLRQELTQVAAGPRLQAGTSLTADAGMEGEQPVTAQDPSESAELDGEVTQEKLDEWFAQFLAGELSWEDSAKVWAKVEAAGKAEELLAMFQARVDADPNNPDLHAEMGDAYIQHLNTVGNNTAKVIKAANAADTAFNSALALDEHHLGARRSKAISLSFWPPIMGKQPEAIRQFETLIESQNRFPAEGSHVQADELLGNLHVQQGNMERAMEVWNQGLARFPGNEELMERIRLNGE